MRENKQYAYNIKSKRNGIYQLTLNDRLISDGEQYVEIKGKQSAKIIVELLNTQCEKIIEQSKEIEELKLENDSLFRKLKSNFNAADILGGLND